MSALGSHLDDYLRLRRSLGHDLAGYRRLLPRFVAYLESAGEQFVTIEAALAWSQQPDAPAGSTVHPYRLMAVRGFARYMAGIDPRTEVPPRGLIAMRVRWRPPFIYTEQDIVALMSQAHRSIPHPLRAATVETLIGLLATTGMRIGEAIRLDRTDIDWSSAVLLVRQSKFGKSRQLPLTSSALRALESYAQVREALSPCPSCPESFFVSLRGTRLDYSTISRTFRKLCRDAGLGQGAARPPRIHDLRHTFAVHTLLGWYRENADVQAQLPLLSTYLGHREPRNTYRYLSAAPELLAFAARRLENTRQEVRS
ncbi:MAG TPA: tyrosine-type recombinase/integrase [Solirubrobacteraceae bacterium]|nr:tyrosine-type recombinase/integrase [Solirubrobacteraceae bacterium]